MTHPTQPHITRPSVLGFPIDTASAPDLRTRLQQAVQAGQHQHVVTLNPEMIMQGLANESFGQILKSADVILPDGAGVVWALKRQGIKTIRLPGIEFSDALIAQSHTHGTSIALIGAAPEVNDAAAKALSERYPGLNIAYRHHGFFDSPEHIAQVAQACADAKPSLVLVALGVPRQEEWIREHQTRFTQPAVFVGVGGSLDVWSGIKQRAHPLFISLNCEWLWRLGSEPWRIKRLYKTLPLFVLKVWGETVFGKPAKT